MSHSKKEPLVVAWHLRCGEMLFVRKKRGSTWWTPAGRVEVYVSKRCSCWRMNDPRVSAHRLYSARQLVFTTEELVLHMLQKVD